MQEACRLFLPPSSATLACGLSSKPALASHAPRHVQGTSPIYNLLPDILSNLSKERGLGKAQFQSIMQQVSGGWGQRGASSQAAGRPPRLRCSVHMPMRSGTCSALHPHTATLLFINPLVEPALTAPAASSPTPAQLLAYIKKDKQGDSLIEKLCQRFAATEEPAQWHSIAFCLVQVRAGCGRWSRGSQPPGGSVDSALCIRHGGLFDLLSRAVLLGALGSNSAITWCQPCCSCR